MTLRDSDDAGQRQEMRRRRPQSIQQSSVYGKDRIDVTNAVNAITLTGGNRTRPAGDTRCRSCGADQDLRMC